MVPLAARVATFASVRDQFDAATLGRAAVDLYRNPQAWSDWATPEETWQHIKQLWHVLVRFGRPFGMSST
jgi:DNA phosphorothioation-dependent restriction protein DptG